MAPLVLVVEDSVLIQEMLEWSVGESGYAVQQAYSGEEAIEILDANDTPYKALITDVNLCSLVTGWDVARRARELSPGLPVVYATSIAVDEWSSKGVPNSLLLTKPFDPEQIVTALSQLLKSALTS
jgi:DNA-binding response OmpR family regulator